MITVKITTMSGDSFVTSINETFEGAKSYYFDLVRYIYKENQVTGKETYDKIILVELV